MAITNKNIYKYTAVLVSVLALALLLSQGAFAAEQPATTCKVRANVTIDDAVQLTGVKAAYTNGQVLTLEGPTAGDNALICTYSLIIFATNVVFIVILTIAVLLIGVAAFLFLTAGNKPDRKTKARNFLVYAIAGLLVAVLARVVPAIARGIIGV